MTNTHRTPKPLSAYGYFPASGEETVRCQECRETKSAARKSWRCAECAAAIKAIHDSRLMPDPFFTGSMHNFSVEHAIGGEWREKYMRPLAEGERKLGWMVLPPFQRPPVWTTEQRIKLIESIWLELPIGAYIYNSPEQFQHPTEGWLIDGQQRVGALFAYVADEFPVFGYRYSELPEIERSAFRNKRFPAIELTLTDAAELEDVYNRLAYGGTPHEPPK
jgi:hypothetical protein